MKSIKYILVTALVLLASVLTLTACNSAEVTYEKDASGNWTYSIGEDGNATLVSYVGEDGNVVIPATIIATDGSVHNVTAIGDGAFVKFDEDGVYTENTILVSVRLAEDSQVTAIPNRAFYMCSALKSVELRGTGVTSIGDFSFYGCKSLTSFVIPGNVDYIGAYAFRECAALKSVYIMSNDKIASEEELNIPQIGTKCFYMINKQSNDKDRYYLAEDFKIYVENTADYDLNKLEEFRKSTKNDGYKYWSEYEGHIEAYAIYGGND